MSTNGKIIYQPPDSVTHRCVPPIIFEPHYNWNGKTISFVDNNYRKTGTIWECNTCQKRWRAKEQFMMSDIWVWKYHGKAKTPAEKKPRPWKRGLKALVGG